VTPDPSVIAGFLRDTVRDSIQLVAISDAGTHGHWFGEDVAAAVGWAERYNAQSWNVYWTVNACKPGVDTKPSKIDLTHARFVHVDIDPPRDGSAWDMSAALERAEAMNPSAVVSSGGGVQALWRLDTPATDLLAIEAINRGVIARLGGDPSCWNADRLFRLPGTVNYPTAAKLARGRVPALAAPFRPDSGAAFTAASLAASFPPAAKAERPPNPEMPAYTFHGADDLFPPASPRLRDLIDSPRGADRSGDTLACACEMASSGYDDAAILGVLLNPANAVSAHCLEQGDPERAALRAAAQAGPQRPSAAFAVPAVLPPGVTPLGGPSATEKVLVAAGFAPRPGYEIVTTTDQPKFFKGCVYIRRTKRVRTPRGDMLDKEGFDVEYGGYEFTIDRAGSAKRPTSAWEAFTRNRAYECPMVDTTCFRPELESGLIFEEEGLRLINTWVPIVTERLPGDVTPFTTLLGALLPDPYDRETLTHWMASAVQNPGVKFQWWPVLQGVEGNGKTTLIRIMMHAIGFRYTHLVNPEAMAKTGGQFNGWVDGNLFVGFEEIWVGANRRAFLDSLKATVTNDRIAAERKGQDQYTADNRINGMMCTNHKDGVPITADTRRYAIYFTAQQSADDLTRDGLTEAFFGDLYAWLNSGGYGHVTHWLATYPLRAELDPAQLCLRAPITSSRDEALVVSLGGVEQEILAAIDEDRTGFKGGWVSARALDLLIDQTRAHVPRIKRRDLLCALGYDYHPYLPDGKASRVVMPDGLRTRLFLKRGHLVLNLTDPAAICRAYEDAQVAEVATPALRVV